MVKRERNVFGKDEPARGAAFLPDIVRPNDQSGAIIDGTASFEVPLSTQSWKVILLATELDPKTGRDMLAQIIKSGRRIKGNSGKERYN